MSEGISKRSTKFCLNCSKKLFNVWKGWPLRDQIPIPPVLVEGICSICQGSGILDSKHIAWLNYHGPYNTGLPDHWELYIGGDNNGKFHDLVAHWDGLPFNEILKCPKCKSFAVVSKLRKEIRTQCEKCGFLSKRKEIKEI